MDCIILAENSSGWFARNFLTKERFAGQERLSYNE